MRKIVIMGASSGIGYAVAEVLASRGVKVGLAARNVGALAALKDRYPDFVEYTCIDITRPEAVAELRKLIAEIGGMDIYFHVAGIGYDNVGLDPERDVRIVETNCAGFARMVCAAYNYFRSNNRTGQIAAVTSVAGTNGVGMMAAYSASKAFDSKYLTALEQLSNIEGVDVAFTDIRPGWTRTPLLRPDEHYPLEMELDEVVPQVLRAIVRRRRVAVIDRRWSLLAGMWRLLPDRVWVKLPVSISMPGK